MILHTLAHLSDLHFGQGPAREAMARALCQVLIESTIGHVVVTGDITNKGRDVEMSLFLDVFAPLFRQGRLTVVPGNHDRIGDDAGRALMKGRRVAVEEHPGLYLVLVDSTAEHDRGYWACHGELTRRMLDEVDAALDAAPEQSLVAVLMHHHLVALPVESWLERISERLRLPTPASYGSAESCWSECRGGATWCCTATATCRARFISSPTPAGRSRSTTPAARPSSAASGSSPTRVGRCASPLAGCGRIRRAPGGRSGCR